MTRNIKGIPFSNPTLHVLGFHILKGNYSKFNIFARESLQGCKLEIK